MEGDTSTVYEEAGKGVREAERLMMAEALIRDQHVRARLGQQGDQNKPIQKG